MKSLPGSSISPCESISDLSDNLAPDSARQLARTCKAACHCDAGVGFDGGSDENKKGPHLILAGNLPLFMCWPALALFCLSALGIERLGVQRLEMERKVSSVLLFFKNRLK